eukprot:XP_011666901.1 PREDICTED: uncharacterized protein LOC105439509 [Strongylocentrotus purpuratus]
MTKTQSTLRATTQSQVVRRVTTKKTTLKAPVRLTPMTKAAHRATKTANAIRVLDDVIGGVDVIIGPSACGHSSCATASVVNNSKAGWYSSDVLLRPNMTRGSGEQGVARRRAPKKSPSCRDRRGHKTHGDINRILREIELEPVFDVYLSHQRRHRDINSPRKRPRRQITDRDNAGLANIEDKVKKAKQEFKLLGGSPDERKRFNNGKRSQLNFDICRPKI